MDRLSPLDALFVDAEDEDPRTSMAIGSIAVFEGPLPPMRSFWLSCPGGCRWCRATGRNCARCRSGLDGRSGSTTRISILVTTSGGWPCRRQEETGSSPS